MNRPYQTEQIAAFALKVSYEDIPADTIDQLKRHLLDATASLLYATTCPSIQKLVRQLKVLGNGGPVKVPLLESLLGMAGCSINSMVTSRASYTYEWKGFASSLDALDCTNIVLLAQQGMTGPIAMFEGPRGVAGL